MRQVKKIALAALGIIAMTGATNANLSDLRWQNRVVLFFAPTPEDARLMKTHDAFSGQKNALKERDTRIFFVPGGSIIEPKFSDRGAINLSANALRKRYKIKNDDFRILLIGKDGGVKFQTSQAVGPGTIFGQIDQMPMRQREMK